MKRDEEDIHFGSGNFGRWFTDVFGLPAYEYDCMQSINPIAKTNTSGNDSIDHFHQVGNDRITLTAHNGGYLQYFIADRGLEWISFHDLENFCLGGGICFIEKDGKIWSDLYNSNVPSKNYQRVFGCGYFQKIITINDLDIEHFIYPPFGDEPIVISEIKIKNNSNKTVKCIVYEYWGIKIRYLIGSLLSMMYLPKDRVKFGESKLVSFILRLVKNLLLFLGLGSEQIRNRFSKKFSFKAELLESENCIIITPKYRGRIPVKKNEMADRNYYHKPIFLKSFEKNKPLIYYNEFVLQNKDEGLKINRNWNLKSKKNTCLIVGHEVTLKPQEEKSLSVVFGIAE